MTPFNIVVAADSALGIGKNGALPWRLSGDMAWFKQLTSTPPEPGQRNTVFMGRKTWESIPHKFRPLPGRLNIVITRQPDYQVPDGVLVTQSIESALAQVANGAVFCVGGGEIYSLALGMDACARVYLTRVEGEFGCDTFLPSLSDRFVLVSAQPRRAENGVNYDIATFDRRQA